MAALVYGPGYWQGAGLFSLQVIKTPRFHSVSLVPGYSNVNTPDMLWWDRANLPNVEYIDVADLNIPSPSET